MTTRTLAYFITSHGFGHAARSAAVMTAVEQLDPTVRFEVFTLTPDWFFAEALKAPFGFHSVTTDVGLVQITALIEDAVATADRLAGFLPFDVLRLDALAKELHTLSCSAVLCDVSALGVAVAQHAGLASILIENFTWDWIYEAYVADEPRLADYLAAFGHYAQTADHHIQIEPVCQPMACDLVVDPVSRPPRLERAEVRRRLGVPEDAPLVLLTMGGIVWDYAFLDRLRRHHAVHFLIPGVPGKATRRANTILLPANSGWHHPDLVRAADAVVGKLGYSTLAETYHAGIPFGYIPRPRFRESLVFESFVANTMPGLRIDGSAFASGTWLDDLDRLLALSRRPAPSGNGAKKIAAYVLDAIT